ncbi:glycosyl hydrolase 115 family protein [Lentilactobacillus sp. Marseille-Q4993]|uniref:glycosyl hydrolase 115 family protein n=1 Tax=Lentilactobacillus sp. Marseille-Q4993 TaxID=3039492 RepID=UPI0024BC8D40|nr:glycosyl hydrolase 115 family protein [Lentilactobacillus sp. Marseille-Q4993]
MQNKFLISQDTVVTTDFTNDILRNAAKILTRDIDAVVIANGDKNEIKLILDLSMGSSESFKVTRESDNQVTIASGTERGVMYGALAVSRTVLKVDDFWFWMDKSPKKVPYVVFESPENITIPNYRVKYRGWFVNDEVMINNWDYRESSSNVWQMVYETLLRCGGNMIIPGTGHTAHLNYESATKMGLIINHHHAEPLGAEMFSRVYPDLDASYLKHPDLFKKLWQDAISEQKSGDVIWTLGFRGQGDRPFWLDDDREYTLADRANVINDVIRTQYDLIKQEIPDAQCSINIYGEITGLYNAGLLDIPNDIIQIWADNGYGRMVSRRQGNDDPRSDVLSGADPDLPQGVYYHVAFHDLQASNFLSLLQIDPHSVAAELDKVRQAGMDEFVMCNTGNIKPNILYLRLMEQSWKEDFKVKSTEEILQEYVRNYYSEHQDRIVSLYEQYFDTIFNYGDFEDQKAGDEFYTYTLRKIVATWISQRDKLPEMEWLTGDKKFIGELAMINQLIANHVKPFEELAQHIKVMLEELPTDDSNRLYNDLWLSVAVHSYPIKALKLTIDSFDAFFANNEDYYVNAFLRASEAAQVLQNVIMAWQNNPNKKWVRFYDNDCYTNISLTIDVLGTLTNYIRIIGDGPDEDQWEREYLMDKSDAKIMLLSNTHKAYDDNEMALRLQGRFGKNSK